MRYKQFRISAGIRPGGWEMCKVNLWPWCFVYVNVSGWVLVAHCVGLLSISTLAACRREDEVCWDLPGVQGQLLPTAHSPQPRRRSCREASRGAGEAPCQGGHPPLWGCRGSGQPARSQHQQRWEGRHPGEPGGTDTV